MSVKMRVMDGAYTMQNEGYSKPEPIINLFCRGEDFSRYHISVDGFYPYFLAPYTEVLNSIKQLQKDDRVRNVEMDAEDGEQFTANDGERLAKITTIAPYHIRDLREFFDDHYEAKTQFIDRFMYDTGIVDTIEVTGNALSGETIGADEITPLDDPINAPPRIGYLDIEVMQSRDGPSVISERGKELADNPITAITHKDSYQTAYHSFILRHSAWDDDFEYEQPAVVEDDDVSTVVKIYDSERELLQAYAEYIEETRPDVLTAWNASFDFPYLINRYLTLEMQAVYKFSDIGDVDDDGLNGEGKYINSDVVGPILFDLLVGYEKSQIHELDDSSLSTVAAHETDIEKLDVDSIDNAWKHRPQEFIDYSIRDVEAMVKIDDSRGILL